MLMAVRLMMETLVRRGPIESLEMAVRFRRPMFWDICLEVFADCAELQEQVPGKIEVRRPDGKVANDASISQLSFG